MSSKQIFEMVNHIHHLLAPQKDHKKPLGGKQLILVGQFLQPWQVPSLFAEGRPICESELFQKCLTHRYELLTNMQQNATEHKFLKCLKEIRLGQCNETP